MPYWCALALRRTATALLRTVCNSTATKSTFRASVSVHPARPQDRGLKASVPWLRLRSDCTRVDTARWCPGTLGLIMDGLVPAKVPDSIISEIRSRERNGAIELPWCGPRRGDQVRILRGLFQGACAIFADMKPHERVEVLLMLLGGERPITLAQKDVAVIR